MFSGRGVGSIGMFDGSHYVRPTKALMRAGAEIAVWTGKTGWLPRLDRNNRKPEPRLLKPKPKRYANGLTFAEMIERAIAPIAGAPLTERELEDAGLPAVIELAQKAAALTPSQPPLQALDTAYREMMRLAPPYPDWALPSREVLVRGPNFACQPCRVERRGDPEGGVNQAWVWGRSRAQPFKVQLIQGQTKLPRPLGSRAIAMLNEAPVGGGGAPMLPSSAPALPDF